MKQLKHILTSALALLVLCLTACTDVELIDNSDRATSSLLKITFDWNGEEADKPAYMHLIAVRNVMTWRAHGYVATEDGNAPWFGYSEPIIVKDPEPEPEPEPTPEPEPEPEPEPGPNEGGSTTPEEGNEGNEGGTSEGNNNQPPGRAEGEGEGEGTEPGTDPTPTPEPDPTPEPEPTPEEERIPFRLRGGEYNILAVNANLNSETVELKC